MPLARDMQAMQVLKHRSAIEYRSQYNLSRGFFITTFISYTFNEYKTDDVPSVISPFCIS